MQSQVGLYSSPATRMPGPKAKPRFRAGDECDLVLNGIFMTSSLS
jgi:hypothetical protein